MAEIGRRVALGEQPARLLELQRGLEGGREVVAARDHDRPLRGGELLDDQGPVIDDGLGCLEGAPRGGPASPASPVSSARVGASAATRAAPAASWATYDLVAATDRSSPARQSITWSAAAASGEAASLAIAIVVAPPARAASTTATRSGERPLCETAITRPPRQRTSAPYSVVTDGAARPVGIPSSVSIR